MSYLLAALGGKDRFPLLEGVQPLRLAVQHIVVKLFKVDIQSYLGAALKAVQLYLLLEAAVDAVQKAHKGDLVHVEFLGKIGKLALYRIGIISEYLFIIFGFRREVFLPELPRNAGLLLLYLVADSLPFAVKAHFVSPILYLFLFLMYESTNPHVLSRNSFIFLFS